MSRTIRELLVAFDLREQVAEELRRLKPLTAFERVVAEALRDATPGLADPEHPRLYEVYQTFREERESSGTVVIKAEVGTVKFERDFKTRLTREITDTMVKDITYLMALT